MIANHLTYERSNYLYDLVHKEEDIQAMRDLCKRDLFYLLTRACKRFDADRSWIYDRCREVEANPDGHIDLWSRAHYKSSVITFALTIQDILNDPEITVGIFSHTRPIAKAFMTQIKSELESNSFLKDLFPDILYQEPARESQRWSVDGGIIVKRNSNPKESTVDAWGLVDGQPTSKHYKLMIFDDVVTRESVTTPEQIKKTTEAWALALNLGTEGGKIRYVGTHYHFNDTWKTIIERKEAIPRIFPATDNGLPNGNPVLITAEELEKKRKSMGSYVFACQMLLNPVADSALAFKKEWLNYFYKTPDTRGWNIYLICDPAGSRKKQSSDYTVMLVIALGTDNNYYLIDGCRDRMNLTERTNKIIYYHKLYKPKATAYEQYGMQADIEHIKDKMAQENYRFAITELGGNIPKVDRIGKLIPIFEYARFWLPLRLLYTDIEGKFRDLTQEFVGEEFLSFPVSVHDDMLDCMARILDPKLNATFPKEKSHDDFLNKNKPQKQVCEAFESFSFPSRNRIRRVG